MSKLLPNLPIENLTEENDYIGIIEKGELIKRFFLANEHEFAQIKFFSIYGEWGSGKSTLMKYLEKELKGSFNTFFFEAWEYESDKNLANSLLEFIVNKSSSKTHKFLRNGSKLMEGFANSITFKTPVANFNVKEIVKSAEVETFFELKEQFKEDFIDWESKITSKNRGKDKLPEYNIVFIDDLDRCEPENVLNLLSAIKLFFTFGKKTIFFCGIDKKAVTEAVKTKYGEVVKASEYLEKVFDISFTMPKNSDVSKLIHFYFDDEYSDTEGNEINLAEKTTDFFEQLRFTNPRRIKKILNKYLIIQNLIKNDKNKELSLPHIITQNSGTLFETYLTLYLLILKEFSQNEYELLFNLSAKRNNYYNSFKATSLNSSQISSTANSIFRVFSEETLYNSRYGNYNAETFFRIHLANFSPIKVDSISGNVFNNKSTFVKSFNLKDKKIEYYFTIFMFENEQIFKSGLKKMKMSLIDYKILIKNLI